MKNFFPYAASHARKIFVVKHYFCGGQSCVINNILPKENGLDIKSGNFFFHAKKNVF